MLYSVTFLVLLAASAQAAFFEFGACSTEAITKQRQPLIANPAANAYVPRIGFSREKSFFFSLFFFSLFRAQGGGVLWV